MCCGSSGASGIAGGLSGDLMDEALSHQKDPIQGYGGSLPCTTCSNPKPYTYAVKHLGGLGLQTFFGEVRGETVAYGAAGGIAGALIGRKAGSKRGAILGTIAGVIGGGIFGPIIQDMIKNMMTPKAYGAVIPEQKIYVPGYGEVVAVRSSNPQECGPGTFWVRPADPGDPGYCVQKGAGS